MATINESTSIIAVRTKQLVAGQTSIVYVSSTTDVGQLVTVFDIQGFLSAPQSILVSSVNGINLGAGLSTVRIQQTFGYVTLRSITNTSWSVVNENAFRSPASNYSVQGLQFGPNVFAQNLQFANTISTTSSITNSLRATSAAFGPLFVSTFGHNVSTFVTSTLYNSSNLVNRSSLFVALGTSILSSATIVGPVNVQSNLNVAGTFTTASTMFLESSLNTTQRILVNSNISISDQVFVGSNIQCFTNARTSTVTAQRAIATNLNTNTIRFDGAALMTVGPNNSLAISSGLIVPNTLQTSTLHTETLSTQSATILSTIFTPAISISNAAIVNTGGSLAVSSIQATSIQYTTLLGTTIQSVAISSSLFSTFYTNGDLYALSSITTTNGNIQYLQADNIVVNSIRSGGQNGLAINSMSISTITVSSAFVATTMSSFVAPNARIGARAIDTTAATVLGPVITSSLSGLTTIYDTGRLTLSTPALYTSSLGASYLSIAVGNTSTLTLSNAVLGPALIADPAAPYFLPSTFSGFTSNTPSEYIQGTGAPWSPFHIVASDDLDAAAFISGGTTSAYLNIKYTYATTALSTNGTASIILKNPIRQSTLITLSSTNAPSFQTYALSNYFVDTKLFSSLRTETLLGPMTYAAALPPPLVAGGASVGPFNLAYSPDGGDTWTTLPYVGFETATWGITYGGSKWVAVGDGLTNTMIFSYTGTVWYNLGKPVFTRGLGVAYNGTLWVAVGEGTNTLATSTDGITWTGLGTSIFSVAAYAATWNGSIWLACGAGTNTLATSPDGITWTGQGTSVFSVAAYAATWNGAIWVAVGAGTNTLATSTNGTTWTGFGTTVFQTSGRAIAWNGTNWVAGSDTQLYVPIAYSTDGTQWIRISCPLDAVYSVAWTGTQWLAGGTGSPAFATSPTGLTWTSIASTTQIATAYAIATGTQPVSYAPTKIVAVGQGVANIILSSDGLTWTSPTNPFENPVNCVAWNGSIWVIGTYGVYQLGYSTNGIAWTGVTISFMTVVSVVAWGKGKWIAVGTGTSGHTRAESADGITWTPYAATSGNFFSASATSVIWAQGIWVATGAPQGSGILFSLDGTNWIPQYTTLFSVGNTVYSNGTMFVAGGTGGSYTLAYSLEGSLWAPITPSPFTTRVNDISWANGVWVAVGQGTNTIAYSYNGITWIGLGTSIFSSLGFGVVWTGALWVAVGSGTNSIATSLDGITWRGQGTTYFLNGKDVACQILQPNTATATPPEPVGIRWITSGVAQITPTVIEKPARTNPGYDSYARSTDAYTTSAFLQFRPYSLNGSVRIGLTTSTVPLSTLSYAFQLTDTGTFEIWEGGAIVLAGGAIAISDTFQISYDGTNFYFQKNSVNLISFARSPGLPLFLEAQFNLGGTRLYDLEFHPLNQISGGAVAAEPNQFYTTSKPVGLLTPTLTFTRPLVETGFSPSFWQFAIPMSGTLVTPSSSVYADVYLSTNFLFSTATLATALTPTISTFNLSYVLSTSVATTPGDLLKVNLYTQHGPGITSIYSTTMTTGVYNLEATQFVELVHNTGSKGAQTSDFSLWIQTLSTPFGNYVNSDAGLEMNRGFMRWNQRLYGTTIQNQYNDLQTRTLTYTGALYTASDSNLKHDTAYADTGTLYETLKGLPLHRYRLSDSYRARFGTEDGRQLGVLTTEVAARFPSMIKVVDSEFVSDLQTVDRIQFRYAHLGATQHIMGRLSTLRGKILGLVGRK